MLARQQLRLKACFIIFERTETLVTHLKELNLMGKAFLSFLPNDNQLKEWKIIIDKVKAAKSNKELPKDEMSKITTILANVTSGLEQLEKQLLAFSENLTQLLKSQLNSTTDRNTIDVIEKHLKSLNIRTTLKGQMDELSSYLLSKETMTLEKADKFDSLVNGIKIQISYLESLCEAVEAAQATLNKLQEPAKSPDQIATENLQEYAKVFAEMESLAADFSYKENLSAWLDKFISLPFTIRKEFPTYLKRKELAISSSTLDKIKDGEDYRYSDFRLCWELYQFYLSNEALSIANFKDYPLDTFCKKDEIKPHHQDPEDYLMLISRLFSKHKIPLIDKELLIAAIKRVEGLEGEISAEDEKLIGKAAANLVIYRSASSDFQLVLEHIAKNNLDDAIQSLLNFITRVGTENPTLGADDLVPIYTGVVRRYKYRLTSDEGLKIIGIVYHLGNEGFDHLNRLEEFTKASKGFVNNGSQENFILTSIVGAFQNNNLFSKDYAPQAELIKQINGYLDKFTIEAELQFVINANNNRTSKEQFKDYISDILKMMGMIIARSKNGSKKDKTPRDQDPAYARHLFTLIIETLLKQFIQFEPVLISTIKNASMRLHFNQMIETAEMNGDKEAFEKLKQRVALIGTPFVTTTKEKLNEAKTMLENLIPVKNSLTHLFSIFANDPLAKQIESILKWVTACSRELKENPSNIMLAQKALERINSEIVDAIRSLSEIDSEKYAPITKDLMKVANMICSDAQILETAPHSKDEKRMSMVFK